MQLEEFLQKHPSFIEDLEAASKALGKGKHILLSGSLKCYAEELKDRDPQRNAAYNPFNPI